MIASSVAQVKSTCAASPARCSSGNSGSLSAPELARQMRTRPCNVRSWPGSNDREIWRRGRRRSCWPGAPARARAAPRSPASRRRRRRVRAPRASRRLSAREQAGAAPGRRNGAGQICSRSGAGMLRCKCRRYAGVTVPRQFRPSGRRRGSAARRRYGTKALNWGGDRLRGRLLLADECPGAAPKGRWLTVPAHSHSSFAERCRDAPGAFRVPAWGLVPEPAARDRFAVQESK